MTNFLSSQRTRSILPYVLLIVLYIVVTSMTDAFFMGDTRIYVRDISNSASLGSTFWDAGHPFWRPLGWLISRLDHRGNPAITLLSINWGRVSQCPYRLCVELEVFGESMGSILRGSLVSFCEPHIELRAVGSAVHDWTNVLVVGVLPVSARSG